MNAGSRCAVYHRRPIEMMMYISNFQNCARYIMDEECFYQCEPTLIKYQRPNMKDAAHGVPICASYCDAWFEACKDDQTCVVDWLTGFNYTNNIHKCPDGSKCRTFKEVGRCCVLKYVNDIWNELLLIYIFVQNIIA